MGHGNISLHVGSNKNFTFFYEAICCKKIVALQNVAFKGLCINPATSVSNIFR